MKTCHKCNARVRATGNDVGHGKHTNFTTYYACMNGHTGRVEGQVGQPEAEWTKRGAIFGPKARADAPKP